MKRTRILPLLLAILMILALFAGCSAPSKGDYMGQSPIPEGGEGIYDSNSGAQNAEIIGRKLIRTITIEAETKDLDALLTDLDTQLATLGGYVQSKQVRGSATGGGRRYASMTLRIPADKLDQFVNHVSGATNILSNSETTEDVTLKFIATESRIAALEAEEARVMELIGKAENLNELLTLESKLSGIRQELEEVKSQLKLYENLIDYGTVYLSISEEKEYTVVVEDEPTVWERISTGFVKSLKNVIDILKHLVIFFFVALPYFLPILIPAGIIALILFIRSKKKKKKEA